MRTAYVITLQAWSQVQVFTSPHAVNDAFNTDAYNNVEVETKAAHLARCVLSAAEALTSLRVYGTGICTGEL